MYQKKEIVTLKIEIKIECECETEFSVKVPEACLEENNKNPFVLNCPYCQVDINYKFHIEKINQEEYEG
jgi:hypothetical protein